MPSAISSVIVSIRTEPPRGMSDIGTVGSGRFALRPCVPEVHLDRLVEQADPPVATRLVRELLVDEAARGRGPQVEQTGFGDAKRGERLPGQVEDLRSRRVRLWRRFEPR